MSTELHQRIASLQRVLGAGLVERETAVRLVLLSAIAGEHLLLLGPPGTAKSMIARRLHLALDGAYFERLLTRFSVPEELFGPLSIKGLEGDRYERLTDGYLPTASVAFVDEIFKANSAILNSLLTLLNERLFDNGANRVKAPLMCAIGASNEMPEGDELDALYDRFLLRLEVNAVSEAGFRQLIDSSALEQPAVAAENRFTADELRAVQQQCEQVVVPEGILAMLMELRRWCLAEQIVVSDRRWGKIVRLLRVSAWTNGRREVSVWDLWLLQHCIWAKPADRAKVFGWYAERVGAAQEVGSQSIREIVVGIESVVREALRKRQAEDDSGQLLYVGPGDHPTIAQYQSQQKQRGGDPLFQFDGNFEWSGYRSPSQDPRKVGVTRAELDKSVTVRLGTGGVVRFSEWADRDCYLEDPLNQFPPATENRPLMVVPPRPSGFFRLQRDQAARVESDLREHRQGLSERMKSLKQEIERHLWVDDGFAVDARKSLEFEIKETDQLIARVEQVKSELNQIPQEG